MPSCSYKPDEIFCLSNDILIKDVSEKDLDGQTWRISSSEKIIDVMISRTALTKMRNITDKKIDAAKVLENCKQGKIEITSDNIEGFISTYTKQ